MEKKKGCIQQTYNFVWNLYLFTFHFPPTLILKFADTWAGVCAANTLRQKYSLQFIYLGNLSIAYWQKKLCFWATLNHSGLSMSQVVQSENTTTQKNAI